MLSVMPSNVIQVVLQCTFLQFDLIPKKGKNFMILQHLSKQCLLSISIKFWNAHQIAIETPFQFSMITEIDGFADQCWWCYEELLYWRLSSVMARRAGAPRLPARYPLLQQCRANEHMSTWTYSTAFMPSMTVSHLIQSSISLEWLCAKHLLEFDTELSIRAELSIRFHCTSAWSFMLTSKIPW